MKTGKTIQELAAELQRQKDSKRDYIAGSGALDMAPDAKSLRIGDGEHLPITRHAHTQLATRLDLPQRVYDRFQDKHPEILQHIVNQLFIREPQTVMVRTLDRNVRAIMSNSYRSMDNADLAEAVLPVLVDTGATVESCEVTPKKLYIKAVRQDLRAELPVPEGLRMGVGHNFFVRTIQAGICISNSEVGCGSISVSPAFFERQCTNYARFADSGFRKTHLGRRQDSGDENFREFLTDETRRLDDAALWGKVRDLTLAAMDGRIFDKLVRELSAARHDAIVDAPKAKVVEVVSERFGFNERQQQGVLEHLMQGGEFTRYGLQWAITRLANDAEDYEEASELERAGGRVIEMKRADWAGLLQAASEAA